MQNISLEHKIILITGVAGFIGANLTLALLKNFTDICIVGIDNMNDYYDVSLKEYRLAQIQKYLNSEKESVDGSNVFCTKTSAPASEKVYDRIQAENLKGDSHIAFGKSCGGLWTEGLNVASDMNSSRFQFIKADISDKEAVFHLFQIYQPDIVVNLAAQAGVRYSITNPDAYVESNLIGFYNILEACRHSYDSNIDGGKDYLFHKDTKGTSATKGVEHLIYASSSSVYGSNAKIPYSTEDKVDNPVSLYAATKKSNELMAHAYAKLYNIPSTGLRFFTVYGPAGRPDMAYFGFTDKLRAGEKIQIFNYGNCRRDFTYIDDIVEGVIRVMQKAPEKKTGGDGLPLPPYAVYNIGNNQPENLLDFVDILQQELVRAGVLPENYDFEVHKELVPMQPGDVAVTYADTSALEQDFGFKPQTDLRTGLRAFAEWYKDYYKC